jgi:glutamine synthetase
MFLQEGPHNTMILYIPSVFISYNGEALDEKSVLLRSSSVISKVALEILHLIEPIEDGKVHIRNYLIDWLGFKR